MKNELRLTGIGLLFIMQEKAMEGSKRGKCVCHDQTCRWPIQRVNYKGLEKEHGGAIVIIHKSS